MKQNLIRLFAISMAMALGLGSAAQLPSFHATLPSGQSLRFEVTSPTTCQLAGNNSIGGSETDSLIIPYTVSDGTNTYQVTAIGQDGINGFLGRGTLILPNSITRIEWHGINSNDFDTIIFPAGLNFMDNGAFSKSPRVGSASVLIFRSATPPATTSGIFFAFTNEYTSNAVQHIYVPAGQTAAFQAAFQTVGYQVAFPNATLHEWGTSTPTVVDRHDTIHPGEVRWINNRPYDGTWTIRDSSLYYTQNLITRVFLNAVEWHFYADAPTGQRLYYRITGTDSVEVRAPNGSGWAYYTPPTDSLAIPATVTHDGHTYSVFRIYGRAFYRCDAITALTLPEGIAEVGPEAIFIMTSRELRVSLPRSLRIIDDYAFNTYSFSSRLKLASDTIWAEVIGREAFFPKVISQPIVLPNVRSIGYKAFYRIESCPYLWVGDSCTSIGEQAFAETTTAPIAPIPGRISLGTSLQTVGASAFSRPNGRPIHSVEFRGATVPSFGDDVFWNTQVDSIITPCGASSAYRTALYFSSPGRWDPSNTVFQERGCPVYVHLYDTLFYAMGPVTFAGRSITSPGEYRDTIHLPGYDSINILFVSEVYYSFYADAPTGQRLYYRIAGTDSVEVVAPNEYTWTGYTKPAGSLTIPAAVTHGGTSYSVVRVSGYAFHICTDITLLTLSEGIAEVEAYAFEYCDAITYVSLPRSLRIVESGAFYGMTRYMSSRNLTLASDTIWAETIAGSAFSGNIISQPIVLPNVRTIGIAAFSHIRRCPYIFVGDSCTSIGENAFDNAFYALPGRISLGTSLQTVGHYALSQYATIRSVEFRGATVPSFGEGIFFRTQVDSIITPCGTSAAYRTALDAAPVNNQWDASATLFAERGCPPVIVHLYDTICAGGNYTFGGRFAFYTSAASHELSDTVHFLTYDSITLLHLEVEGTMASSMLDVWICETALPYTWDGETVTTPGTHNLDHRVYSPRGCLMRGGQLHLTVLTRPHTYIYDTVRSTAKGLDRDDTNTVTLHRSGNTGHCPDSLVTTYTHYDFDETIDTLRLLLVHSQCDGTYLFGGIERTASGSYADTVVVDAFHVTITTLDLTIRHSTTGTETADVCDTYTWQGTTYTASNNTDQVTLTNAAGCDSTVTLNLTVRHSTTGDTAAVAFDRFAWYGTTYTASGTPTHVLTNAVGCDSTVTLALTILEGYAVDPTFGEQGIEVEAYGYCAGPGAVRYRLSSGQPDEYSLIFGHAAWTNLGWQRIATPGNIDITVPDGLPTGDYTATLYFRHSAYPDMVSSPIEVTIHVNLPETYVMPLFSDVIALVDTCHCLTDVQWYHREAGAADWEAIPGANDYYYHQEGGLTGEYFVSARYNGQPTYTCPQSDVTTLITEPQPTLTAYPNPTRDVVTLELLTPHSSLLTAQTHVLRVLNLQGVELERRVFEGSTLQLDLSAYQRGSYVVSVDGMVVRVIRN